jgi:hypothetical protein
MSPVFATRRRAEQFHTQVETSTPVAEHPALPSDLLDLVAQLRAVEPAAPRPDFSTTLRADLLAAADTLLLPSEDTRRLTLPPRHSRRDRRIAAVVGAAALVGASSSLAVAAQSALPGDMLYPLKRVLEDAEAGAQLSEQARGESLLDSAADRLSEVTALLRTGDLREGPTVARTLTDFSDQSLEAAEVVIADYEETGDDTAVLELRDFAATSMQTLAQVEAMLPDEAQDELQQAAEVLTQIDADAAQACPSCSGGITQIPSVLLSSAGRVAVPEDVEVVPAPVVDADAGQGSGGQGRPGGSDGGTGGATGGAGGTGDNLLPDSPSIDAGGGGGGQDGGDPIDDITDALTDDETASQGGGGTTGVDPLDDVLEDVDDTVDDTVDDLTD